MKNIYFKNSCFITILCLLFFVFSYAQETTSCEQNIEKAKELLSDNSPFNNEEVLFKMISDCAELGDAEAENLLGVFYINGVGTEKNLTKAYELISRAASKNNAKAQYNLGRMYKKGEGVSIDFQKAIDWFEKAKEQGNQRATYSLGYMYYKGLGVEQDYQKALYWFRNSDDHMAKHFLGLSYYQGYGVTADEEKALEILLTNNIVNSATLIKYIQNNQKQKNEKAVEMALNTNTEKPNQNDIAEVITTEANNYRHKEEANIEDMQGDWVGRLIQYDWSGAVIERVLPIEMSFDSENDSLININYSFLKEEKRIAASKKQDYLYFKTPFNFRLNKLYSSNPRELTLDYELLSIHFKKQIIGNHTYLTGKIDSYIKNWKEYGQPTSIVLKRLDNDIDIEMLNALAAQEDQFIKLYPIPLKNQLTIQYELESDTNVQIELVGLYANRSIIIAPASLQKAGKHTYNVPISGNIPEGIYVVRLTAGNRLYTRLITKEN